jgi:hypothetical protein
LTLLPFLQNPGYFGRSDEWQVDKAFFLILGKLGSYPARATPSAELSSA